LEIWSLPDAQARHLLTEAPFGLGDHNEMQQRDKALNCPPPLDDRYALICGARDLVTR
jgi:hypothetical protein